MPTRVSLWLPKTYSATLRDVFSLSFLGIIWAFHAAVRWIFIFFQIMLIIIFPILFSRRFEASRRWVSCRWCLSVRTSFNDRGAYRKPFKVVVLSIYRLCSTA